jgi:hypothetical protein
MKSWLLFSCISFISRMMRFTAGLEVLNLLISQQLAAVCKSCGRPCIYVRVHRLCLFKGERADTASVQGTHACIRTLFYFAFAIVALPTELAQWQVLCGTRWSLSPSHSEARPPSSSPGTMSLLPVTADNLASR